MNSSRIALAWVLTVVGGSILFPFVTVLFNGEFDGGLSLLSMIVALILSAMFSVPTLIVLLIVQATNASKTMKTKLKRINLAHIIMLVLTIGVGDAVLYMTNMPSSSSSEQISYNLENNIAWSMVQGYTEMVAYYAVIAVIVWILLFRKIVKAALRSEIPFPLQDSQIENPEQQ